jgi:hypothetical protein
MFLMMNEARLLVGTQGLACAGPAYLHALTYARERIQGRHLLKAMDKSAPSVPIIQHPDVRRMLMLMKVWVEAMRSLLYYVGYLNDLRDTAATPELAAGCQGLIDILIPVAKGYVTDRACEVCNLGIQVYGGYGYIRDYPMEQLLRDCRITPIYEGTNGIQAMDLLGRKLGQNGGRPFMDLLAEIGKSIAAAHELERTRDAAKRLGIAVERLGETALQLGAAAMSERVMAAFAGAAPFMEVCGDVIFGWMLLWRGRIAAERLASGAAGKDAGFYEGQLKSLEFFIQSILPVTLGKMDAVRACGSAAVDIADESFGGR